MNAPFQTDAARLRVRYDEGATEEWLTAGVLQMALQVMSSGAAMQGRMEMTTQYISSASRVFGFRAPAGRLDEQKRLFATMVASVQVNPAWDAALNGLALNLAQIQIQSAAERSRIWSEAAAEVSRIRMAAWENQQASQDRIAAAWSQTMRGVETFVDPGEASQGRAAIRASTMPGATASASTCSATGRASIPTPCSPIRTGPAWSGDPELRSWPAAIRVGASRPDRAPAG